jgi:peptide deformylase
MTPQPETETAQEDLRAHQLVFAPHTALSTAVPAFPEGNAEFRHAMAQHMKDLMVTHRGIGLAANQINLNAAVHVQMVQRDIVAMFNPQIHEVSPDMVLMSEGCLSEPGLYLKVSRPDMVLASWEDESGARTSATLFGMDARVFLHEFDHLQGVMFTDRVGKVKLQMARKKQGHRIDAAAQRIMARMN